jgi:hypothetical protein
MRCFDSREIVIRMEYRFCPNMILIDTPGLIQAPTGRHLNPQQRALAQAARESEELVKQKMRCQDYIILCVEDTTDWKHSTTRNVVQQVDPTLERTVLVSTKLDTKLPQFDAPEDLEDYVRAPLMHRMHRSILGGPFFTTVPCGRVGREGASTYFTNEAFVQSVRRAEREDCVYISSKLGHQAAQSCLPTIGVSKLRWFLERRVEDCYRRNVARIVPLLQRELTKAEAKLISTEEDLNALSLERLRQTAEQYREQFVRALGSAIQGTIRAPPETYGETLEAEQLKAGSFLDASAVEDERMERLMELEVGNSDHRLFGGAQYHRTLREFSFAVKHMAAPEITEDEIANSAGIGDMHDGINFMRAACVIAVEKARTSFDPLLESLRVRTVHVMKRLFSVVDYMLKKEGVNMNETHQKPFSFVVRRIFENFVEASVDNCLLRCKDDLRALTRFVTWDLSERSSGALQRSLPDTSMVQIYSIAVESTHRSKSRKSAYAQKARGNGRSRQSSAGGRHQDGATRDGAGGNDVNESVSVLDQWEAANAAGLEPRAAGATSQRDYYNLMQLMEEASCSRDEARTNAVVSALVRHIIASWREHFARSVAMKFNCFFMMPFVDDFPSYLRMELDKVYDGDVSELFDIAEARSALQHRRDELIAECKACHAIQAKFDLINVQLNSARKLYGSSAVDAEATFVRDATSVDNDGDLPADREDWDYSNEEVDVEGTDMEELDSEEGDALYMGGRSHRESQDQPNDDEFIVNSLSYDREDAPPLSAASPAAPSSRYASPRKEKRPLSEAHFAGL